MRRALFRSCLAVTITALVPAARALEVGQPAPDFTLPGRQAELKLAQLRGQAVYLDFWASWCGPCRQSFPWLNQMQARYGPRGLRVVGVNLDQKAPAAAAFLAQVPAHFDIVYDPAGQTPRAYGVKAMPTSVLIAPDGKVLMIHGGFREDQREELERRIAQALPR